MDDDWRSLALVYRVIDLRRNGWNGVRGQKESAVASQPASAPSNTALLLI